MTLRLFDEARVPEIRQALQSLQGEMRSVASKFRTQLICIRAGDRPLLGVRQAWASIRRMTWSSIFGFMFFSFLGYWLSIVVAGMGPRTPLALDPSFPPRDADFPRR